VELASAILRLDQRNLDGYSGNLFGSDRTVQGLTELISAVLGAI